MKMTKISIVVMAIVLGSITLAGLGIWQLQRLAWKNALIERVTTRSMAPPVGLTQIDGMLVNGQDPEYLPVRVSGIFDHHHEQYYYAIGNSRPGWHVYTPMILADHRVLFVNRGFVPVHQKDPSTRRRGQVADQVTLTGLVRVAPNAKPNRFVAQNDPEKNVFYWRGLADMVANAEISESVNVPAYFIDAAAETSIDGGPVGGVTRLTFSNNHLQYVITWFGLCAALIVVGVAFLRTLWKARSFERYQDTT